MKANPMPLTISKGVRLCMGRLKNDLSDTSRNAKYLSEPASRSSMTLWRFSFKASRNDHAADRTCRILSKIIMRTSRDSTPSDDPGTSGRAYISISRYTSTSSLTSSRCYGEGVDERLPTEESMVSLVKHTTSSHVGRGTR